MKKILIVEDEEGMLDGLAHNFRYEIGRASCRERV